MEKQRHASALSPSNSMLVPYNHRQLAVVPPITAASRMSIPVGWGVEAVPRQDGSRSDMYYYEPGTGRKFRSVREVNRYLNGEEYRCRPTRKNSVCGKILLCGQKDPEHRKMIVSGGKLLKLDDEKSQNHMAIVDSKNAAPAAPFVLPDGWIVEEVPRKHVNWVDKYYYEPGTGQKFRSLVGVERYLAELEDNAPLSKALEEIKENKPLSKIFKLENHTKNSSLRKKNTYGVKKQASSFISPPTKVNWVLASPRGDVWNPFISETLVPDSIKQQWTNRFMLLMSNENSHFRSTGA